MKELQLPSGLHTVVSYPDKKTPEPINLHSVVNAAETLRLEQEKTSIIQNEAKVNIDTSQPVYLAFFSDVHAGSIGTHHDVFLQHMLKVKHTSNVFAAFVGDMTDSFTWLPNGANTDILTLEMQGAAAQQAVAELDEANKLVFVGTGNHDDWIHRFYSLYYKNINAPIVGRNHGSVDLRVGDIDYRIFEFHKMGMGNSSMNWILRHRRAFEYHDSTADIYVGAHVHTVGIDQQIYQGRPVTFINSGTYKIDDDFQRSWGNVKMPGFGYGGVGVLLYPDRKMVAPFLTLDEGVRALEREIGLRTILKSTLQTEAGRLLRAVEWEE